VESPAISQPAGHGERYRHWPACYRDERRAESGISRYGIAEVFSSDADGKWERCEGEGVAHHFIEVAANDEPEMTPDFANSRVKR
jgi:hypothetical protein